MLVRLVTQDERTAKVIAAQIAAGLTHHLGGVGYADGGYRYGVVANRMSGGLLLQVIDLAPAGIEHAPDIEVLLTDQDVSRAATGLDTLHSWFQGLAAGVRERLAEVTGKDATSIERHDRETRSNAEVTAIQDYLQRHQRHNN